MSIIKSTPAQRVINGKLITTSEVSVVSESFYETNGEACIVIRGIDQCKVKLNAITTDHTVIKAMTNVTIVPDRGWIDEEFDELVIGRGACVEFRFCAGTWYITRQSYLGLQDIQTHSKDSRPKPSQDG
jgi:hypothetical protein